MKLITLDIMEKVNLMNVYLYLLFTFSCNFRSPLEEENWRDWEMSGR